MRFNLPNNLNAIIEDLGPLQKKKAFILTLSLVLDRIATWVPTGNIKYHPNWGAPVSGNYITNRGGRATLFTEIKKALIEKGYIRLGRKFRHSQKEKSCSYYVLASLKDVSWSTYEIDSNNNIILVDVAPKYTTPFTVRRKCEVCENLKTVDKFFSLDAKYCSQCWVLFKYEGKNIELMRPFVSFRVLEEVILRFDKASKACLN